MKRLILLLMLSFTFLCSDAQVFEPNFLGEDFQLYKGAIFKLKEDQVSGFSYIFYSDLKYLKSPFDKHVIYSNSKYRFNTDAASLANRAFIVDDIIDKNGGKFEKSSNDLPIFILKDTATSQKIYFKYDKEYEHNFPFISSKIVLADDKICSKITRRVDDFKDEVTLNSPVIDIVGSRINKSFIVITKLFRKAETNYFLTFRTYGSTAAVDGKNVAVLFTDGTKWENQVKIDVEVTNEKGRKPFEYTAFIALSPEDLIKFSTNQIRKYRLYIFDQEIYPNEAEKFKVFVKCIREAK